MISKQVEFKKIKNMLLYIETIDFLTKIFIFINKSDKRFSVKW